MYGKALFYLSLLRSFSFPTVLSIHFDIRVTITRAITIGTMHSYQTTTSYHLASPIPLIFIHYVVLFGIHKCLSFRWYWDFCHSALIGKNGTKWNFRFFFEFGRDFVARYYFDILSCLMDENQWKFIIWMMFFFVCIFLCQIH